MRFRSIFIFICFVCVYALISARLYVVQIYDNNIFSRAGAKSERAIDALATSIKNRGQIFFTDRAGVEKSVALAKTYPSVFVSPRDVKDVSAVSETLASLFGGDAATYAEKISIKKKEGSEYLPIEDRVPGSSIEKIQEKKLSGISIEDRLKRFYPYQSLGSQVIGYTDASDATKSIVGNYGIEKFFNDRLAKGEDIRLTIDNGVQTHAETLLEEVVKKFQASNATVIVQNPKTGEILAMASKPDFDPNEYGKFDVGNFLNPAVQLTYEPGSVIKPITLAAGIDTGKVTPQTTYVDTGSMTLNGLTIHNFRDEIHGKITMQQMIEKSINTGAIYAERLLGHANFKEYLARFGFSEQTGIELPGEVTGNLKMLSRKDVRAIDFATAAYGQGITVTPLELISAYSVFANDGVLMRPYITKDTKPQVVRRVIKSETAQQIKNILVSAVVANKLAVIPDYNVAGKTGTAFIANPQTKKYVEDDMVHTFIGFAPATDPQFTILVKVERPRGAEAAGATALPVFKGLAEFLLTYYHVAPDNLSKIETQ